MKPTGDLKSEPAMTGNAGSGFRMAWRHQLP